MNGRILVVDDEQNIRKSLQIILVGEGFEVEEAADGETALDYIVFGEQEGDRSYGRTSDGAAEWTTFEVPTPMEANRIIPPPHRSEVAVEFSREPGLYPKSQTVKLSASEGGDIWYTLDGNDPRLDPGGGGDRPGC